MKLSPSLLALALSAVVLPAMADEPAPDPLSFNVGAVTEYRYRGISQTRLKPALQGGVDYAAANGFYVGAWASSIKWIKDAGGDSKVEVDLYGGYKTEVAKGLTLDVGLLQYVYSGNKLNPSANTLEVYGALSFGPVTAKYSQSTTNLFGFADSKGSGYFDVTATFDLGDGLSVAPHIGHQTVKHNSAASYTDYSVTLAKDFSGLVVSGSLIGTDANKTAYASPVNGKFMGKSTLVLGLKKTF
ncbi:TorF family putative porin [Roseateles sp. BYS87W]|uniref:TorF family putative porin n=1 Tax=Pelomonas baiyunensis TaxID=3299026 RepID=A0ABW7H1M3_9BURK